ncbi:MAG: cell envelope biogenesis protein TolA [Myxococcaceae bacterium]|nr:cell envelope biogenesis protein TolA [Myxococcaceae bacterium]
MAIALVLVSVALVFCLYLLLFGKKEAQVTRGANQPAASAAPSERREESRSGKAEAELEKKRKELEDLKHAHHELKDELKALKKKLFDDREAGKTGDDLAKARAEVERQASLQLESTRAELATALAEIQKLKSDEGKGRRGQASAPAPAVVAAPAPVAAPEPPPQRVIRELSDADKERIAKAESTATKERARAVELDKEVRSLKTKIDLQARHNRNAQAEAKLSTDKFRAIEKRQNRLLLERDLMVRAIRDLEKKAGVSSDRIVLTADEVMASDKSVDEKVQAELEAEAQARAKLEAQQAAPSEQTTPGTPSPVLADPSSSTPPATA